MMVVLLRKEINLRQLLLRYGFPLILGSLLPLAFAPYNLWPIALVIPALLFWRIDKEVFLPQVFLAGWAFGLGYFGFGVYCDQVLAKSPGAGRRVHRHYSHESAKTGMT